MVCCKLVKAPPQRPPQETWQGDLEQVRLGEVGLVPLAMFCEAFHLLVSAPGGIKSVRNCVAFGPLQFHLHVVVANLKPVASPRQQPSSLAVLLTPDLIRRRKWSAKLLVHCQPSLSDGLCPRSFSKPVPQLSPLQAHWSLKSHLNQTLLFGPCKACIQGPALKPRRPPFERLPSPSY